MLNTVHTGKLQKRSGITPLFFVIKGKREAEGMEFKIEPLGGGVIIHTTPAYRFGTDAILLADFAAPKAGEAAADLGCGGGIIPLLWCRDRQIGPILGLELQEEACRLARRSAEESGVSDRLEILEGDLRQIQALGRSGSCRVVTCNPPYRAKADGLRAPDPARAVARHELTCTLPEVARAAAYLLSTGGRFCLCQRPERLCDAMLALRQADLEPKRLRLVCQRAGAGPWLFLLEGRRGGRPGLRVLPTLYLEEDGRPSREMEEIYGIYRENRVKPL